MKRRIFARAVSYGRMHLSNLGVDAKHAIFGGRDPLVPPRRLDHNRGFHGGEQIVAMMRQYVDLQPHHRVFDIGCGIGSIAKPLAGFLSDEGSYVGVDIVERAVKWLQQAYRPRHPNFKFYHLDVHNSAYNPSGKYKADAVEFPFPGEAQFDIVFLISVFTHMYPQHIRHYLELIERQLKPGGRLFASMFINDDFAQAQQKIDKSLKLTTRRFRQKTADYYAPRRTNPEYAVAFDLEQLDRIFAGTGLIVRQPFVYGIWCSRPAATDFYQDVVVATKQGV